jgi:hypothetical protein
MKSKGIRGFVRKVFGDIKVFRHPMFIAYDPGGYQVTGQDLRRMLGHLAPGDILLRRFHGYLDGRFIPGRFTHAAIHCGALTEADRPAANVGGFKVGPQMVVHALAPEVVVEDILTFARCDELAILRLPPVIRAAVPRLPQGLPTRQFMPRESQIDAQLAAGGAVLRGAVVPQVIAAAVSSIGLEFDFDFRMGSYRRVYCSELVYRCLKSVQRFLTVRPTMHRAWFMARNSVVPDDFLRSGLQLLWISESVAKADPALAARVVGDGDRSPATLVPRPATAIAVPGVAARAST